MSVGFMGAVLSGEDPGEAWRAFRAMVDEDPAQRALVLQLAETKGGRSLLDDSRSAWRERGYKAPFDFIFEESGHAEELR